MTKGQAQKIKGKMSRTKGQALKVKDKWSRTKSKGQMSMSKVNEQVFFIKYISFFAISPYFTFFALNINIFHIFFI